MKIFIDIGHPAHVHYFKNFIQIMKNNGYGFLVTARDKEVTHNLLDSFKIKYIDRGKGKKSLLGKLIYIFRADFLLLRLALKYKPDIFMSFSSPYAAQVSWLLRRPHIAFDDTEHAKFEHIMYVFFTDVIFTPNCFQKDFGKKHIRFNGFMELCYLHPNYFTPDPSVLDMLGVKKDDKYVILRFVSWGASHDIRQSGLTLEMKRKLATELSKHAKVFISSEDKLPADLKRYQIKKLPEKIHDVLSSATLFIGEGATMASECAMLGTPAIYVNTLSAGTLEEQGKYGLIFCFRNSNGVFEKALQLLQTLDLRQEYQKRKEKMLSEKIDVTAFMVWFIENYPKSISVMKANPDYQYKFK